MALASHCADIDRMVKNFLAFFVSGKIKYLSGLGKVAMLLDPPLRGDSL